MNDYPKKQQIKVLMSSGDDDLDGSVFEFLELTFKNKYDLKFIASDNGPKILELADKKSIDIFILVINNIHLWGLNTLEDRLENNLQLITQIKTKYGKPVIALLGWREDSSVIERAKIFADFFFFIPFEFDLFKDAIEKCFEMLPRFESENSKENIWTKFNREKNPDDIIADKTNALAILMTKSAYDFAITLHTKLTNEKIMHQDDFDKVLQIYLETVCLYLNAVDRDASIYLHADKRGSFMNKLMMEMLLIISEMIKENIMTIFIDMCKERQNEYGTYTIIPPSAGTFKGTLFWEYGKKIAKIAVGTEYDVLIINEVLKNVIPSIMEMQLKDFFLSTYYRNG